MLTQLKVEAENQSFSGTILVKRNNHSIIESFGYANKAEQIKNTHATRYGIASGSKLFTSIAIFQLIERGFVTLETKISDCLTFNFPHFDDEISIKHLLTHTSGIPDYFDESVMDDFEELWINTPMYRIRKLVDFLPLFQYKTMKETPGSLFRYNNSGYILLGLIIEQVSGQPFSDYVTEHILTPVGMKDSGYFELDALPGQTALGYIEKEDGSYRTNLYSVPVKGGADGGIFVTVADMEKLWRQLYHGDLLSKKCAMSLLSPQVQIEEDLYYSYCGYMEVRDEKPSLFIFMGYDPGVNYRMTHFVKSDTTVIVCSNHSDGAFNLLKTVEKTLANEV
ncbi:LOW QUALITY PROTEIN: beta-lactamase class C [Bacillus sp. JCM 19046]|nr:LOW QUALITY PROTEIN: beta-lactamase class C [Bacillus sp. JCM 19045]GAF17816.1 LOW QUALITY PROTEIN: beta-lactamase class C [Bacillus sp. JCM 19046]